MERDDVVLILRTQRDILEALHVLVWHQQAATMSRYRQYTDTGAEPPHQELLARLVRRGAQLMERVGELAPPYPPDVAPVQGGSEGVEGYGTYLGPGLPAPVQEDEL